MIMKINNLEVSNNIFDKLKGSRGFKCIKSKLETFKEFTCLSYNCKKRVIEEKRKAEIRKSNYEFSKILLKSGVKELNLTSLGNSIATGHSEKNEIIPLLKRNDSLCSILNESGIELNLRSYARPQDNNDEHIFEWINSNITQEEINSRIHAVDYSDNINKMNTYGITKEKLNEYYPLKPKNDIGLNDLIMKKDTELLDYIISGVIMRNGIFDQKTMNELIKFIKERYPHDYFYTDKKTIISSVKHR